MMQYMRRTDTDGIMDCEMLAVKNSENQGPGQEVAIVMGPRFMAEKYYQKSPAEVHIYLFYYNEISELSCAGRLATSPELYPPSDRARVRYQPLDRREQRGTIANSLGCSSSPRLPALAPLRP